MWFGKSKVANIIERLRLTLAPGEIALITTTRTNRSFQVVGRTGQLGNQELLIVCLVPAPFKNQSKVNELVGKVGGDFFGSFGLKNGDQVLLFCYGGKASEKRLTALTAAYGIKQNETAAYPDLGVRSIPEACREVANFPNQEEVESFFSRDSSCFSISKAPVLMSASGGH